MPRRSAFPRVTAPQSSGEVAWCRCLDGTGWLPIGSPSACDSTRVVAIRLVFAAHTLVPKS